MMNVIFRQCPQLTVHSNKQKGSALLMTLFVVIVLMLLGTALVRVLSSSSEAIAQEVIGTRAYMAANSAMQAELHKLFPLNTASGASTYCNAPVTASYDFSTQAGLYHCGSTTTCTNYATHPITNERFYRLTSTGKCESTSLESDSANVVVSSRTIQVEARSLQ